MEQEKQIRLTSGEVTQLVMQYMQDSSSVCTLGYFLEKVEDAEIKPVIEHALQSSEKHVQKITAILTEEKYVVPHGLKVEEDVDINAPRLYSDSFALTYIHQMTSLGLASYAASLSLSVRSDITAHFKDCLSETMELFEMVKDVLLSKGLYVRAPYLPNLEEVDFVQKQRFIWDILGEKRPLIGSEIGHLYANIQRNALGAALLTGYSQVAKSKDVTKFILRCIEISKKHITLFSEKLKESDLPVPMTWDTDVTKSTTYTFSDKIMMYQTAALISTSTGFYGLGIAQSPRADLGVMYNRLSVEIQKLSEDGANIMINNKWLEQPPMAPNRKDLAKDN
ncbi:DUF3231 family protein [Oceanobacillus sojae]|uniref:DUF3231 family protein n=1 Tax=Oceanobacillus sojae TaxID=582851 RepID=UPI0021A8278D|nr:DUF3231 family protein [Oceanobacillus sojae]MCT1904336.1 DUF3231 family protein [Oceanobacillus sojae]